MSVTPYILRFTQRFIRIGSLEFYQVKLNIRRLNNSKAQLCYWTFFPTQLKKHIIRQYGIREQGVRQKSTKNIKHLLERHQYKDSKQL